MYPDFTTKDYKRFWERVTLPEDSNNCWLWKGSLTHNGYGRLPWRDTTLRAHRFAYEMAYECDIPTRMLVLHGCDNPSCVNPNHLFLGTQKDNIDDMFTKKRANKAHKVSDEQVREIRARYALGGVTKKDLANEYGVTQTTISFITLRKTRISVS